MLHVSSMYALTLYPLLSIARLGECSRCLSPRSDDSDHRKQEDQDWSKIDTETGLREDLEFVLDRCIEEPCLLLDHLSSGKREGWNLADVKR